ncbi:MAG TPA: CDP-alcohol phosphatidyltransferase family protein [Chthoniobacterales bacterium]|nr:CDP-alcohol phosphatidyltransferase family protein [Chthoniobacterales bacterium]
MTPPNGQSNFAQSLAFKSVEIEELADVYFFRPAGSLIARAARALGLTPTGLTIGATLLGIAGGVLLYNDRLGLVAFVFLILHSIVDSADGQLARMTGRETELGRVLDGLSGYATHAAIYFAIAAGLVHRGGSPWTFTWMFIAGMATAVHAGMYDYHRNAYIAVVEEAQVPRYSTAKVPAWISWLFAVYLLAQRSLVGSHTKVEAILSSPALGSRVPDEERQRYREIFYPLVRGWNFLGDNTRFFAMGVLVCLHRIELYFVFVLAPMNLAFVLLWFWQRSADRRFLASV